MKRRYWAVRVDPGYSGPEWWIHRDDSQDIYATPDIYLSRQEARQAKKDNAKNPALDPVDRLEVVELAAIIRSTGS